MCVTVWLLWWQRWSQLQCDGDSAAVAALVATTAIIVTATSAPANALVVVTANVVVSPLPPMIPPRTTVSVTVAVAVPMTTTDPTI